MVNVIQSPEDMASVADQLRTRGNKIGFVPTMGALHEGHMSLIRRSVRENDVTVVSIFVNPTQFDEQKDFDSYPRDIESDLQQCEYENVDFAFVPDASDMYRDKTTSARFWVETAGPATETLCGLSRPGHFRGVMTICAKLSILCSLTVPILDRRTTSSSS
ncbi:MAG: pantoate--beta-alanine ligase [Planctomycetota bacterium]|nr:pantoate--beta-alanine ligase [Planctomycetota bacterium]